MGTITTKPYAERTDDERLRSCWHKCKRLMERGDWSAAITRAATAAEISVNIAIRKEFQEDRGLDKSFVDSLMMWANGIMGKFDRLLKPLYSTQEWRQMISSLGSKVKVINGRRNEVVHSGNFMNQGEAETVVAAVKEFIEELRSHYESNFDLDQFMSGYREPEVPLTEESGLGEEFAEVETGTERANGNLDI